MGPEQERVRDGKLLQVLGTVRRMPRDVPGEADTRLDTVVLQEREELEAEGTDFRQSNCQLKLKFLT